MFTKDKIQLVGVASDVETLEKEIEQLSKELIDKRAIYSDLLRKLARVLPKRVVMINGKPKMIMSRNGHFYTKDAPTAPTPLNLAEAIQGSSR